MGIWVIFIAIGGAVVVVAILSWYFSADQKARRAMLATPVRPIRDVVDGERVRVIGAAEPIGTVNGPLSGRPCVYWRVFVQEQRGSKNRYWVTVIDEHEGVDFFVRDGDQRALVKTTLVRPILDHDAGFSSGFMSDATPELEAFLADRGHSSKGWVFNKNMRYREGIVEPNETIAVVGTGRWEHDPDGQTKAGDGYREAALPRRLVIEAPEDGPLLLSDEPSMTAG